MTRTPRGQPLTCPECGLTTDEARVPGDHRALQWGRIAPILASAAFFVAACFALWLDRFEATTSSGHWVERPVAGVDRGVLEAIAEGRASEPDLAAAILEAVEAPEWGPGRPRIDVGFGPAPTRLSTGSARGWPTRWMVETSTMRYRDARSRIGPVPARTDPLAPMLGPNEGVRDLDAVPRRQRWRVAVNEVVFSPPPEETGGRLEGTSYRPLSLLWPVVVGLCVAFGGAALAQIVAIIRRKPTRRSFHRWTRRVALLCAGLMLLPVLLVSRSGESLSRDASARTAPAPPGKRPILLSGFEPIAEDRDELRRASGDAEANRMLAQRILEAAPADPGAPQLYAQPVLRAHYGSGDYVLYGRRVSMLELTTTSFSQTWPFGPPDTVPQRGWDVRVFDGQLWITRPLPLGAQHAVLRLDGLLVLAVGVLAAWLVGRLIARLLARRVRARRALADQCIACGYELGPITQPHPLLPEPKPETAKTAGGSAKA